jgi:hypothetical protein
MLAERAKSDAYPESQTLKKISSQLDDYHSYKL